MATKLSNEEIQALAVRARADDRAAFDELYRHLFSTVWRLCCSKLNGNGADADDVAQNVFLNAYRHLGDYRGETGAEFKGWLCKIIAENGCIDWLRRNGRWIEKVRVATRLAGSPFAVEPGDRGVDDVPWGRYGVSVRCQPSGPPRASWTVDGRHRGDRQ